MIWKRKSKILITDKNLTIYKVMLLCCLKCRKSTQIKNPKIVKTNHKRIMLLSKCSVCNIVKNQSLLKN